jgi:hypothetical protein
VLGIGVAEFGLLSFALYSFAFVATKRPAFGATIALTVAGVISAWLALPAFFDQLAGRNPF